MSRDDGAYTLLHYRGKGGSGNAGAGLAVVVRTHAVIGADGARSQVALQAIPGAAQRTSVFAYHQIVALPDAPPAGYHASRCDVVYRGTLLPDFYGWVFPHGKTLSIGTGSADKGFSQRGALAALRAAAGLTDACTPLWVVAAMALAGLAYVVDLTRRWHPKR